MLRYYKNNNQMIFTNVEPVVQGLHYKGKSRCIVFKEQHIEKVKNIIQNYNDFEYDYMPDNWVTCDNNGDLVYNGKFDIDLSKFIRICTSENIDVMIVSNSNDEYDYI